MLLSHVPNYFKARRDALIKSNPGSVFVFPANAEFVRNPDVTYPFRQESNFYYLSGFEEPDAWLILTQDKMILFVRRRDPNKEMWEGERYGTEGAMRVFGADESYTLDELEKRLPDFLQGAEKVFYRVGMNELHDRKILSLLDQYRTSAGRTGRPLLTIQDPQGPLGEMRLFKSPDEVAMMRKAGQVTALAHTVLMKEVRPGMNEAEVEALIDYTFRRNGCKRVGYGSIVAGGVNAACLHYTLNNQPLKDGDLLLIDAGGEFDYYAGDITRTFPVGRTFSKAQASVYDVVLRAQKACVEMCKPGARIPDIHLHACEVITDGLLSLGLLKGSRQDLLTNNGYNRFFPHRTSHFLGMDVHDVGAYLRNGEPRPLEPGMVLTIEPGFYVQPSDRDAPSEYQNIGIRIEDDILITTGGHENLTIDAPKERSAIEALRR